MRMNGVRCSGVFLCVRMAIVAAATLAVSSAFAADRIRVAAQKTGTLAWELEILKAHGLDRQAGIDIETTELASTEAGKVALESGSVDLMLSDWLWVTRERALGDDVVFYPYSSALGAVMVPANSPIRGIADLKGKSSRLPVDRSIKAGCCSERWRADQISISKRKRTSCMAHRRFSSKKPCKARPTPR